MNKKLVVTEILSFAVCLGLTFIFHFAFEWTSKNYYLAWLFATNESVWEHSKILFYPYFLVSIIEFFVLKPNLKEYLTAKAIPLAFIIPFMLTAFYTYSGIIGKNLTVVDIVLSVVIILLSFVASAKMLWIGYSSNFAYFAMFVCSIFLGMMIIFSYYPPKIGVFFDFENLIYGIK